MRNQIFLCCVIFLHEINYGICVPFFGPFRRTTTVPPRTTPKQREARIINADHGGLGAEPSYAGGNVAPAPWISGTRDQYILDQLVILHPDSPLNRDAWRESGLLNFEYSNLNNPNGGLSGASTSSPLSPPSSVSSLPPPPQTSLPPPPQTSIPPHPQTRLARPKPHRKPKQHQIQEESKERDLKEGDSSSGSTAESASNNNFFPHATLIPSSGGLFDLHQSPFLYRDLNQESEDAPMQFDPIGYQSNSLLYPQHPPSSQAFPFQPRYNSQQIPPEAIIQFLKSPEQQLSPLTRPQVKLPFPLSHDCSSGSGSKPLQFVVLPIVEPVAPLKPLIPRPSFLTSQYGQFPYIPPFTLFNRPPVSSSSDSLNGGGSGGGSSGQFVPILNRPAQPLPFVFVQSLPLELIGQHTEMDVIHAPASSTNTETKVKDVQSAPVAAPSPPPPASTPQPLSSSPPENIRGAGGSLPLIVIEKVKTPGQPPSSVHPAATVVEISKQSVPKNNDNGQPLSTISVVQPITPGPISPQRQHEIQKAIEKLVPVAAAVLENVDLQQQKQLKDKEKENAQKNESASERPSPQVGANQAQNPPPIPPTGHSEQDTPMRAPLRPTQSPQDGPPTHKKPDASSSEEAGQNLRNVEVTEA